MRLFRHSWWQHLDYRVKVATTQENKPPTQGTRQWTFTTPRWRCGSILLPSLNAGVPEPTGGKHDMWRVLVLFEDMLQKEVVSTYVMGFWYTVRCRYNSQFSPKLSRKTLHTLTVVMYAISYHIGPCNDTRLYHQNDPSCKGLIALCLWALFH